MRLCALQLTLGSFELPLLLSDGELVTEDTLLVSVHNFIPEITMITDVPDDQGGRVYLSFNASYFDTDANSDQLYSVFRYDMIEQDEYEWIEVQSIGAIGNSSYTYEIATAMDSTSESDGMTDFKVVASMSGGTFESEVMSGYSVDNIAPGIPEDFMAAAADEGIQLSWQPLKMRTSSIMSLKKH